MNRHFVVLMGPLILLIVLVLPFTSACKKSSSSSSSGGGAGGGGGGGGTTPPPEKKRIFVTSIGYTGNLGGLAGADAICSSHASGAGLGGTWKAWLSDTSNHAIDRIADVGPWYLVNKATLVFSSKAAIASGPQVAINMDQTETYILGGNVYVWTGTVADGTRHSSRCSDWTISTGGSPFGFFGDRTATGSTWTQNSFGGCDGSNHLYCFEQ